MRRTVTVHNDFELYQVLMHNFLCQTLVISPIYIYILFIERISTFWYRDINSIWVLAHFEPKIHNNFLNYMKSHTKLFYIPKNVLFTKKIYAL